MKQNFYQIHHKSCYIQPNMLSTRSFLKLSKENFLKSIWCVRRVSDVYQMFRFRFLKSSFSHQLNYMMIIINWVVLEKHFLLVRFSSIKELIRQVCPSTKLYKPLLPRKSFKQCYLIIWLIFKSAIIR